MLWGIAAIAGAAGEGTKGFDEIGGGSVTLAELGMPATRVETLAVGVELFIAGVRVLAFFPRLGFPLVSHWDMILKQ